MKTIELTQGKSVRVPDEDYEYLNQFKWFYDDGYAKRNICVNDKQRQIFMYKVILRRMGIILKKSLGIKGQLDYCREILMPPLDLSPGPKEILLTQGKIAIVDLEDYEYLMQWNWYFHKGYAARDENNSTIYIHRVILKRMGFKNFEEVDHINQGRFDNRRENLRPATRRENMRNKRSLNGSTSKYKGVSWNKRDSKWRAQIRVDNNRHEFLGSFIDEIEAAQAYNKAAKKYHKEFAYLNIIGE